ncbi:hypothetical protein MSAN_00327400 [Mycena sanguinolenta]|uniref:Protein kinase domain-containing protein n=1 Tax=Mycena sanguinolenta TaxID=230812 RepID=A0A8H6Z8E3_9AGAR|nr:hypothetical protein MSAN_00327400 [Mycena sanguinolenta]
MHHPVGESSRLDNYGGTGGNDGGGGGVQGGPGVPGRGMQSMIQNHPSLNNAHQIAAYAGPSGPSQAMAASSQLSAPRAMRTPHASPQNTSLCRVAVYSGSGNSCSPPPPSRRASVMPTQILIYEALISCLKDACGAGIPDQSPRRAQLHTTLDGYLLSMASDNVVSGIVESVKHLKTLLELSAELGLANESKLRTAFRRDGERIANLLRSIFVSKSLEEAVFRLEGDSAQCFLDVVQNTLDRGLLFAPEDGRMARRIIRKLACSSDKLPSTLFITGITGKEERPTSGGGFADIYRASYNNRIVALKYLRVTQYMRGSDLRKVRSKFCREALVWKELVHHPHILPFLGIEKNSFPSSLSMVSPWMEHGTVLDYLEQHGHSNVDRLLYEIAQGLQYLHSRNVVHGDLRGANILINDDWRACLADFGLSIFSDATSLLTTSRGGSPYWMAPELLAPEQFGMRFTRTPASDVYSFGCVCLELYTGRPPFSGILPEPGAMMKVINGERPPRPSSSPAMSDSLWNYVSMYWAQDPKIRPTMQIVAQNMTWLQPPSEVPPRRDVWPLPLPATESEEERPPRVEAEREAKRISNAIDEALALEREQRKRRSNTKILLLGQAESGKSTILKNFRLLLAPKAFQAEAESWRPVIHLNLVRSVNFVLGLLESRHPSTYNCDAQPTLPDGALSGQLRRLSISLAPLRQVEETLSSRIAGSRPPQNSRERDRYHPAKAPEISLRSGSGLTKFLGFWRGSSSIPDQKEQAEELQTRRILSACAQDIMTLWAAPEVQQGLKDREIVLQEQSGFFLDEVQRICQENYTPTPDDILRARVNTVGPEEHLTHVEGEGHENFRSWTVYDLGGSTSQRAAWVQFFDDVHFIIFLAPISTFNETLAENPAVNRLADSLKLWRTICSNKLLTTVEFILVFNKVDILTRKIQSGIRFAEHVASYGNKPNEPNDIIKYLSDAFATINQTYSPRKRKIHRHVTCAIDTKATAAVINDMRAVNLRNALGASKLL